MAVLYTNSFTGTNGAAPSDFVLSQSPTGGTQDIQSNKFRQQTNQASQAIRAILPAGSWNKADGRVTATFTTQNPVGTLVPQIYARTSGDWSAEIDTPTTCYKLIHVTGQLRLYKRTGGTTTQVGSSVAFTLSASTTYGMTLQCVGTAIKGRIWTGTEPSTWQIEVTDSSVAGPGQFQIALLSQAAGTLRVDWDDVSLDDLLTNATVATGTGIAYFESAGGSSSITITSTDPVSGYGVALTPGGSARTNLGTPPVAAGAAHNATVTTSGASSANATTATGSGVANTATNTHTTTPTAATGVGSVTNATVSTIQGAATANAQVASARGYGGGISYVLDELGNQILDEFGSPIADDYSLTVRVAPGVAAALSTGVMRPGAALLESGDDLLLEDGSLINIGDVTVPSIAVAPHAGISAGVGSADVPSVTTGSSTAVNAIAATSSGTSTSATTAVAPNSGAPAGVGTAYSPPTKTVDAAIASSTGTANDASITSTTAVGVALGAGSAPDAQVDVNANNFVAAAPIPIFATAADARIAVYVNAGPVVVTGTAWAPNQTQADEPGQLITLRDHGHTVTVKER